MGSRGAAWGSGVTGVRVMRLGAGEAGEFTSGPSRSDPLAVQLGADAVEPRAGSQQAQEIFLPLG